MEVSDLVRYTLNAGMQLTAVVNEGQTAECCDCESLAELRADSGAHRQGVGVEKAKRLYWFASER